MLWPFLAQPSADVELVPLERLAEAIDGDTALVAVSAVQSLDGRVADLDAIAAAAAHHGALTYIDATQASGWLPLDAGPLRLHGRRARYKWLLSPRGTSFFAVRPEAAERLQPAPRRLVRGRRPVRDATTARRCGWRPTPAASTSRRRG